MDLAHPTDSFTAPGRRSGLLWIAALSFAWWLLDINLAATILVTPIPESLTWLGAGIGGVAGLWIGHGLAMVELRMSATYDRAASRRVMVSAFCAIGLIFGAVIANQAVWRIVNMTSFWNSPSPITVADFPIRSVSIARGGQAVSIGSAGEQDSLPISRRDLQLIGGAGRLRRPWTHCMTLRRQVQGNAVRVWRPSRPRRSSKAVTVKLCPDYVQWI
jgi:hypothetical protein